MISELIPSMRSAGFGGLGSAFGVELGEGLVVPISGGLLGSVMTRRGSYAMCTQDNAAAVVGTMHLQIELRRKSRALAAKDAD